MFLALVVNPRRTDHVVGAELDSIDPDGQEIELGEITLGEVFQEAFARLDRGAGDLALGNAHRSGHLGKDLAS